MTRNWERRKLGEVCEIGAGNSAPQKKELFDGGKYPFFRTSDVGRVRFGIVSDSVDKLNEKGIKKLHLYRKGTLLFPKSGASTFLNHRVLMATDGYVSSHLATLKGKDNILDDLYLLYFSLTIDSRNLMQDQNYPSLRLSDIQEINILLPSFHEQKRIVKILDGVFERATKVKENAEKNLQNARELLESYLQSIFTNPGKDWEQKRFDQVCVLQRGFDLPTRLRNTGKHPLVSSNGITDTVDAWKVKAPGVVTGRSGTIGNVHFIEDDFWPLNTALYVKEFHGNYERFVFYFLKQFNLEKYSSGAGVPTLNRNNVHSEVVFFPRSISEQKHIVVKLDSLSAEVAMLENIYQRKLADLEELKKAVLHKAFNGELAGACS